MKLFQKLTIVSALMFSLMACSSLPVRQSVPVSLAQHVSIAGIKEARFWGDEWPKFSIEKLETFKEADLKREFSGVYNKPHNYLAISGGGANGGLFAGWSALGTRPEFTMVTGISTGALTAPFAFLGEEYDGTLKTLYTTTTTKDIAKERGIISAMLSDSMTDTAPLKALIERYITAEIIQKIAVEHKRGRRLYIGTVNLDAGRSVIWNIGAIASSDKPEKGLLIRDILRASAAIPVAFPPVVIPVQINGTTYDEMHVDGGTGSQVFVYPASADWRKITKKLKAKGIPQVYVIRNSFIDSDYQGIKRSVLPIAARSIDALIRTQGIGDLYQIYTLCKRDGNEFNLAYIPATFTETPTEGFDPVYMSKLYKLGYEMGLKGYEWKKTPPGFDILH